MSLKLAVLLGVSALAATAQTASPLPAAPRALIVVAHPDDESCLAATAYQITHNLHGTVDQLIITNGEAGFRYSLLAEPVYNVPLTTESAARDALPEIRKQEALDSGKILGIRNHYFLDERDLRYTQDLNEVLTQHWKTSLVMDQVKRRLAEGKYDFVFGLFPTSQTHGAHKAATLMAYRAIRSLQGDRPVLLGCELTTTGRADSPTAWTPALAPDQPTVPPERYRTLRSTKFGFNNVLDYQIIVNWVIAAHKSQGAFQKGVERSDTEIFAILDTGSANATARADALFHSLQTSLPASTPSPTAAPR